MEQALYQAAILTFEELGFVFAMEEDENEALSNDESARVGVRFDGPFSGELVLRIEHEALSVIASNMLGEEGPLEPELLQDVLGEIANVICGNALPEIAGRKTIFRLGSPEFQENIEIDEEPAARAHLGLDEGRADVSLFMN
jgi:CheY-specific phosphatase CheX